MKKSVEIIGLPVISITEGRDLGMSKGLLIDAKHGAVAAIIIEDEDWYRGVKLLPYSSVVAIGDDAVTVFNSETILTLEDAGDFETMMDANIKIIDTKAITMSGTIQGKVVEIYIGEGGKLEKCEIEDAMGNLSEITSDQIAIFGKQVTIIASEHEKNNQMLIDIFNKEKEEESAKEPKKTAQKSVKPQKKSKKAVKEEVEEPVLQAAAEESDADEIDADEIDANTEEAVAEVEEPVEIDERQRRFVLGKTARRTLKTKTGVVIVNKGDVITDEIIQRANLAKMFAPLTLNIQ
ncbi:MAG: PRC-barrel domain-containing protein [Anaerovibrio sp.]|uniref:PRC-barrel domain-containing protein n=1 Tax=Anaerovibrio sp. TaxID=1872532 RepID=UPI0025E1D9D4|nr:PRC-barrel domain-containing protein [Anaerovibrio sp.]MCR5176031.1 PRC-barrel domain-containing protein [Anaerovibrio sp.]